jgi:1-pyrroline-5-carboxylate dehydrogenase
LLEIQIRDGLVEIMKEIKVGPVNDFTVFASAVIDEKAFKRITGYIDYAKTNANIVHGGEYDDK